jgi:hypothetical protein
VARTVVAVRQSPDRDISVAKLDRPVYGIKPLRLATTAPEAGDTLRLTGWGADTGTKPVPSQVWRTAAVTARLTQHLLARTTDPAEQGRPHATVARRLINAGLIAGAATTTRPAPTWAADGLSRMM